MKKNALCWLVAIVLWSTGAAYAQDVTGTWQGTLEAGGNRLRVVFTVASEGGALKGTFYSIDQAAQGIAATPVFQSGTMRIGVAAINARFEGRLSADGASCIGTWSQGAGSIPLALTRATGDAAWPLPKPPAAMAADAPAVFEVATIKPSNPDAQGRLFTVRGRQVITINTTLGDLISFAYDVQARQVVGAPEWAGTEKFDITGQPQAEGVPNQQQLRKMIQQLLADRFKVAFHRDQRSLPVYAIVVGPGGPKLTKNDTNPGGLPSLLFRGLGVLPALNARIADLANVMQSAVLDRPVIDRTGLPGRYDFTLTWTPDESQFRGLGVRVPPASGDPNAPPGLFTAIQEQLGLRFESTNAPVDALVIDHAEKPSEN
ncbi:MAG TPA: TIGR03435 family protein [Vicinamibacterales bacterium]|nr:TIGR03435 family protein [Vicinamibacterales bacterium]